MNSTTPCFRIDRARIVDNELHVDWGDGHRSSFHPLWLRHQCECDFCGTSLTAVRGLYIPDIPQDTLPTLCGHDDCGVQITWSGDNHHSRYTARWLRNHCYSDQERERRRHRPLLWDSTTFDKLPCADMNVVEQDKTARLRLLETVADYGFCKIINAPTDRDQTDRMIALVGQQRQTHFGNLVMKKRKKVNDVGDINAALAPHTDESYRLSTVGITVFQVLCPSPLGGESTLVDGFEAARRLREESPEDFALLTTVPIATHRLDQSPNNGGPPRWFEARLPIIRLDFEQQVCGVRMNERQIAPLDVPADLVGPCYRSLRRFLNILYDPALRLTFKLYAGEGLVFDNQRLLHGRTEFSTDEPARSVLTNSVDLEEFHSNIRLLRAELMDDPFPITFGQGMLG